MQRYVTASAQAVLPVGGGSEMLIVETLVFDESGITSPTNANVPKWGGRAIRSTATAIER